MYILNSEVGEIGKKKKKTVITMISIRATVHITTKEFSTAEKIISTYENRKRQSATWNISLFTTFQKFVLEFRYDSNCLYYVFIIVALATIAQ